MLYTKPHIRYTSISVSEGLMKKIRQHLAIHTEYTSVADFVRISVDERITKDSPRRIGRSFQQFMSGDSTQDSERIDSLEEKFEILLELFAKYLKEEK